MVEVKVYHFSPYDTEELARRDSEKLVTALSQMEREGGVTVELFENPGVAGLEQGKYWVLCGVNEHSDRASLRDRFNLDPGEAWDAGGSGGRWRNGMRCLSRKEFPPGKGVPSEWVNVSGGAGDAPPWVYCLNCFAAYKFNPQDAGKKTKCEKCGTMVVMPMGRLSESKGKLRIPELYTAVFDGNIREVRRLLSEGANPDFSKEGISPLWEATWHNNNMYLHCRENGIPIIKLLLSYGADPDRKGDYGQTPLLSACASGEVEMVRIFVDWCKDVNASELEDGWTPLHVTAGSGCIKREEDRQTIARLLISHGADIGARDRHGNTPREVALRYERTDLADLLVLHS